MSSGIKNQPFCEILLCKQFKLFCLNRGRQRKLYCDSLALSHVESSSLHPQCLCADQLTGTRTTPLRVFAAEQYFLNVYTAGPQGTEMLQSENVHHGVSTGLLLLVTMLH